MTDVEVGDLPPLGAKLGSGGEAAVYDLPGYTLPDAPGPLVYKKYWTTRSRHGVLREVVRLRSDLATDPARLARLDAVTSWPLRQVVDRDDLLGVLLRKIEDDFFCTIRAPQSGTRSRVPAEVQFIFVRPDLALNNEYPLPSPMQRLRICRDFARVVAFLHDELDVVIGDVNAKNELIRLEVAPKNNPGAAPTVMVIDCDAVAPPGAAVPQVETPDWDAPGERVSRDTDLYKLGLFVLRCLKPGDLPFYVRDPELAKASGMLDATGMDLLRAALGPPAARPAADRWVRHLSRLLGDVVDPARLVAATLDKTVTVPGERIIIDWQATYADTLTVTGAGCAPVSVNATSGSGTLEVRPTRTGRFKVSVANTLTGENAYETEPVAVLDLLPRTDLPVPMPMLAMPSLNTVDLPDLGPAYAGGGELALPVLGDPAGWWTSALPPIVATDPIPALTVPLDDIAVELVHAVPDLFPILTGGPEWSGSYTRGEVIR